MQRAKSGLMQRKDGAAGNTFASAAMQRASHEPTVTPTIKFPKQVIGNQPPQVTMPNNLNHLVSPTVAQKKSTFSQFKQAPEKAKSRNSSKIGMQETKSQKISVFEGTFQMNAKAIETEVLEPTIQTSVTTRN